MLKALEIIMPSQHFLHSHLVSLLLRRTEKNKFLQSAVTVLKLEFLQYCFSASLRFV